MTDQELGDDESHAVTELLNFVTEYERIGDYAVNIMEKSEELYEKEASFSDHAKEELKLLTGAMERVLDLTNDAFENNDVALARQVEPLEEVIDIMVEKLRDQHIKRLKNGICSIDNKLYYFDANGVQQNATFGIDVSKYQSSINFEQAKQAGVEFVIIRIGYRGYGSGTLVQDPKFEEHFTNARNAGLRVGVYCFTQAVNENEAREEAQACVYVLNGRQLDYPIYFDTEASGSGSGRADGLGVEDRTKCAVAFCEEVKALGYQPGVYASTTWFRKRLDMSRLTQYNIWNAHYNVASSPIACNMWQGSCTARIPGYGGQLDVNISYMG